MAALGTGLLGVRPGAAGEPSFSSQGWVLVEVGLRNRCAALPSQGLLLSLGVEGHVSTVAASSQDGPEGGEKRTQVSDCSLVFHGL